MGIVLKQSFINTLILFLGFAIGGLNVLFLFTHFLHEDYFGLITFLLSTANIILPLLVYGMQHTIIKFYSSYKTKLDQDSFLVSTLFLPLLVIIPFSFIGTYFYETISNWLSAENSMIKSYTYLIFITAIFMGYFEVFYSWTKVQFKSVFGNIIKEIFARVGVSFLLFAVYVGWLSNEEFIYAVVVVYGVRMLIMKIYAFYVYRPKFIFKLPSNLKEIVSFSTYIIVAGSAAGILLEIDKFMIPQMEKIEQVAYYSVGVFIATVIGIPSRAMQQIVNPLTAKELNDGNLTNVESLYKKTSINLLIVGGLLFLLINVNINEIYLIINKPEYSIGIYIVLMVSVAELFKLSLGTNGAILTNSKYYRVFFYFSTAMALSVIILNRILIELFGIEGAALATLVVVLIFGFIKVMYIRSKFKIHPYSTSTNIVLIIIGVLFIAFYFLELAIPPVFSIILKSIVVSLLFSILIIKFRLSEDINNLVRKYFFK
jgi:O-antigen/teichoic acid export membrane protein